MEMEGNDVPVGTAVFTFVEKNNYLQQYGGVEV
jgi:hypothetical protein